MEDLSKVCINNEIIHLKKDFLGWHVVNPIKLDGKISLVNLIAGGSWWKLFILLFMIIIILGCVSEYSKAVSDYENCIKERKNIQIVETISLDDSFFTGGVYGGFKHWLTLFKFT